MRRHEVACKICPHPERVRMEILIARGASIRSVAKKFHVPYDSLWRHWKFLSPQRKAMLKCGPVQRQALASRVAEESESVIDHYRAIRSGLYETFDAALSAGDRSGISLVAGRLIQVCDSISRVTGELASSPLIKNETNIYVLPQFAELQSVLIRVLAKYPAARDDVIRAFRDLEGKAVPPDSSLMTIDHVPGSAAA